MAIVVSHVGDEFDELCRRAIRQAPLADLIELRLDKIGHPGVDALRRFFRESPKPAIVSCPGAEAFGFFQGSDDERLQLLDDAAENGAKFVDVDWTLSLALGGFESKCHRIVSRHDPDGTPDDLEQFHEDVREVLHEGDLVKLVPFARTANDGLRVMRYLRRTGKGLTAFASGAAGAPTRVIAPILGSPFTYSAPAIMPDEPEPPLAAPGQIRVNDLRATLPPGGLTPETAILGIVGNPVGHSWSPRVHGMALKAAQLDAVYVAFEPDDLESFLALADDENFRGFSVTAPFKEDALRLAAVHDSATDESGAANTLLRDGHRWRAANTDVFGVRETLEKALAAFGAQSGGPSALSDARVLVLGNGGAARAAARAVLSAGGSVSLSGRDPGRVEACARELGCAAVGADRLAGLEWDVLVHATPQGSLAAPGRLPIDAELLRPGAIVLDAVYRPLLTPLLEAARDRGCVPVPGGEWFVRQAREQFRLFTGREPDEDLMRAAFEHALEEGGGP